MASPLRSVITKANRRVSIQMAAALLAGSSLLAALLGLYRDRLLNSLYYNTYPGGLDAYTVAFLIPDFMFFVLVSGALSVTFIPVFNERYIIGNKKSAWELSSSMINFMALLTLVASLIMIIFAEPIVTHIVGPGLDESSRSLAISMMRIIAINPFIFAIASVIASIQQAVGRFVFFSLAPMIYNAGIIIGALYFTNGIHLFGIEFFEGGIMGVALGVVLGSILQLIVGACGLAGLGLDYRFKIFWRNQGFRRVLRILPARSIDQGIDYFNTIVEANLASRLFEGAVRAYTQAMTLHMVPITLIGVAISTAAFPKMTERLSQGRTDLFRKELQAVIRVIVWLALPAGMIAFFCRGYLVNFLFNGGEPVVAGLLGVLAFAIVFRSIYHIASRSFYAQQDTRTPLYISIFVIALNIVLAVLFVMHWDLGIYGLAWAQTIVAIVEVIILFTIMTARIPKLLAGGFLNALGRMVMATGITSVVTYALVKQFDLVITYKSFWATFPKFALIASLSLICYVGVCKWFKLSEAESVIAQIRRLLFAQAK